MLRQIPRTIGQNARLYSVKVSANQTLDIPQPDLTPRQPPQAKPVEVSAGKLSNGVQVAALENFGPVSSLTFSLNGSSRYETSSNLGASHFLRLFGFKGVKGRTSLKLTREFDNQGANLHVNANREQISFTVEFLRDDLENVVKLFSSYFTSPEFALHEVEDVREKVSLDLARLAADNDAKIIEVLHKNAFRTGLGNSIYTPEIALDAVDKATLEQFAAKHFVAENLAVVGTGVDFHTLEHSLAHHLKVASGKAAAPASKYHGGDLSLGRLDEVNRVAVGFETGGVEKSFYATTVLQKILGGSSAVRYGKPASVLGKVAGADSSVESFNFAYSDAGLIGFLVKSPKGVSQLLEQSLTQLKNLASSVSEADLARAKNATKFEYAEGLGKRVSTGENVGRQLLTTGKTFSTSDFFSGVDKVSAEEIKKLAGKWSQSKPTIVAASDDL